MKIDVVVLSYRQEHYWPAIASGLEANSLDIARVICVNDGIWRTALPPVFGIPTEFHNHLHSGFGVVRSANQGIALAQTEYVLLLEGDMILAEGSVRETLDHAEPNTLVCARKECITPGGLTPDHRANNAAYQQTPWKFCTMGHLLVHKPAHDAIGGFDEGYVGCFGLHDYDYGVRWLSTFGEDSLIYGGGLAYHIGEGRTERMPTTEGWQRLYPRVQHYYEKTGRIPLRA